jgi:hypothetical protein
MSVSFYLGSKLLPTWATLEGSSIDNEIVLPSESFDWMDVLASGMTGSWGGGLGQGMLQVLELYGRHESIDHLITLPVAVKGSIDVSPDGDDTT